MGYNSLFVGKRATPNLLTCHHARLDGILDLLKVTIGNLGPSYSQSKSGIISQKLRGEPYLSSRI